MERRGDVKREFFTARKREGERERERERERGRERLINVPRPHFN